MSPCGDPGRLCRCLFLCRGRFLHVQPDESLAAGRLGELRVRVGCDPSDSNYLGCFVLEQPNGCSEWPQEIARGVRAGFAPDEAAAGLEFPQLALVLGVTVRG